MTQQKSPTRIAPELLTSTVQDVLRTGITLTTAYGRLFLGVAGAVTGTARADAGSHAPAKGFLAPQMQRLLNAFQIPTSDDIHELQERVASLTAQVEKLNAKAAATSRRRAR